MARASRLAPLVAAVSFASVLSIACSQGHASERRPVDSGVMAVQDVLAQKAQPSRRLLLGRVVNLASFRAERTLTDGVPDFEETVSSLGLGIAVTKMATIAAFRLSTGEKLWESTANAPCASASLSGTRFFILCGDRVRAYDALTGVDQTLDQGPEILDLVAGESLVATRRADGRVRLFDSATGKRLADKTLALLSKAMSDTHLVADPLGDGICVYAVKLHDFGPLGWHYDAGCFDRRLAPRWSKTLSAASLKADRRFWVLQRGPFHLVLTNQPEQPESLAAPSGPNRGVVVRWRDGEVSAVEDGTFATVEDARGERLESPAVLELFSRALRATPESEPYGWIRAQSVLAGQSIFSLFRRESNSGLGAFDLAEKRVAFVIGVPLGAGATSLEVASGMPIVRTQLARRLRVTVHDPATGQVLYKDERPAH